MSDPIIQCEKLVKIYKVADLEVLALQGLDFTVKKGELMGIVGPSGSGKSTLMNVLGGLVRPSAGKVMVNGQNLLNLSDAHLDKYRRTQVGFVWQLGARNLIPYLNALENVELPMTLAGNPSPTKRAEELLELVGLTERRKHYMQHLSGGEQLRVAIAVSLANNPAILLADEPTGELDSSTAKLIYDAFRTLNEALGQTILIVSHDPAIAHHVDRVMVIRDGQAASETVRKRQTSSIEDRGVEEAEFEELTVLDGVGRLQIPKEIREKLQMRGRVHLEVQDEGVFIRPVAEEYAAENETIAPVVESASNRWQSILRRIKDRFDR